MNESISRLMDGELDEAEFARCCAGLKTDEAMQTWVCYHVIGDQLRGTGGHSSRASRFAAALAKEPTVLAPAPKVHVPAQPATFAWAVAATVAAITVVGWTAYSMIDLPPDAMAKAREAATVRAAQVRPPSGVPADYLVAHQEYSLASAIQGGGSYLRAVATMPAESPRR
ncbi:MAG: sigma-E factor negative regulatory protein [Burkholderiales bacterium]|nr:sigma-E factor negative regulatory protein [Burkholderiales bacterium]